MAVPTWSVGQVLAASDVNSWFVPLAAYKTSALVRSTLTPAIDPDLQFTVAANAVYEVRAEWIYAAASGGISWTWTFPSGAGGGYSMVNQAGVFGTVWGATGTAGTTGGTLGVLAHGILTTASTAGTFGFQWASTTGPVSLTLGAGSCLIAERVG